MICQNNQNFKEPLKRLNETKGKLPDKWWITCLEAHNIDLVQPVFIQSVTENKTCILQTSCNWQMFLENASECIYLELLRKMEIL